jgi:hypothetical protein
MRRNGTYQYSDEAFHQIRLVAGARVYVPIGRAEFGPDGRISLFESGSIIEVVGPHDFEENMTNKTQCFPPTELDSKLIAPVGTKFDSDKLRYDLLDWDFIDEMVRVLMDGAKVHGEYNWRIVENARMRYANAEARHWRKGAFEGEIVDPDHGTRHAAHEAVNAMFRDWFDRNPPTSAPPEKAPES